MLSWCVAIKIFCTVCFEADSLASQELDFRLITTSKNNFGEFHVS